MWQSTVELYLKDECIVWLPTRNNISSGSNNTTTNITTTTTTTTTSGSIYSGSSGSNDSRV